MRRIHSTYSGVILTTYYNTTHPISSELALGTALMLRLGCFCNGFHLLLYLLVMRGENGITTLCGVTASAVQLEKLRKIYAVFRDCIENRYTHGEATPTSDRANRVIESAPAPRLLVRL